MIAINFVLKTNYDVTKVPETKFDVTLQTAFPQQRPEQDPSPPEQNAPITGQEEVAPRPPPPSPTRKPWQPQGGDVAPPSRWQPAGNRQQPRGVPASRDRRRRVGSAEGKTPR